MNSDPTQDIDDLTIRSVRKPPFAMTLCHARRAEVEQLIVLA
jgi:hypothetical protein